MRQPWIQSPVFDIAWILGPAFFATGLAWLFASRFDTASHLPTWVWVALVLCVDVAHVYGTLYRTYFDREELARRPTLYGLAPFFCWLTGFALYANEPRAFWSALAYLAVFHFIRQQYGFAMIYSRTERDLPLWYRRLDQAAIYLATLYPVFYWHTHLPRQFNWFVENDFARILMRLPSTWLTALNEAAFTVYAATLTLYFLKELWLGYKLRRPNFPRALLTFGTAASWLTGIVIFNGDFTFTLTNILTHGIPYMALIWITGQTSAERGLAPALKPCLTYAPLFVLTLVVLAYFEEALWDGLIWRDHLDVFGWLADSLPWMTDHAMLAWIVPLLALPQSTHYVLDGFIWRTKSTAWQPSAKKESQTLTPTGVIA